MGGRKDARPFLQGQHLVFHSKPLTLGLQPSTLVLAWWLWGQNQKEMRVKSQTPWK